MKTEHIKVEFDLNYSGGEYSGVGATVLIPVSNLALDEKDWNVEAAFEKQTGYSRIHIIHYTLDDIFDEKGEWMCDSDWNGI